MWVNYPDFDSDAIVIEINAQNGEVIKSNIIDKKINVMKLFHLYEMQDDKYAAVNLDLERKINHLALPHLNILDHNFQTIASVPFGTQETQLTYQFPNHSTQDSTGNIFSATRSFVYFRYPHVDSTSIEVLTLTKFNTLGEKVWETIDTLDVIGLGINNRYRETFISSVNVSSTGSVYVSGYYTDSTEIFRIDTITTTYYWAYDSIAMQWFQAIKDTLYYDTTTQIYRGIGFLFKYDKNGCRIDNCRMVDSTDADSDRENSITYLTLYPNPTLDVLNIEHTYNREDLDFSIIDYMGKTVMKGHLSRGLSEVDVSLLNSGLYVILLTLDGKVLTSKVFEKL